MFLAITVLLSVPVYSYELRITNNFITNEIHPSAVIESEIVLKRFLETNENLRMRSVSALLSAGEREGFYHKYRKDDGLIAGSFLLNIVCPGAGNLLIGDTENGLPLMVPSLIGGSVLVFGLANNGSGANGNTPSTQVNELAILGGAVLLVCEVLGMMSLLDYANGWNGALKKGLNLALIPESTGRFYASGFPPGNPVEFRFVLCRF